MRLMVHIYTTGPNDSTIYNRYIVQIGVWRIGLRVLALYIIIYINSIMALGLIETFYIVGNIIYCYKIKWLRDGKRWCRDIGIRSHYLY